MYSRCRIFFIITVVLCFYGFVLAQGKVSLEDRLIGSSFKTLAKAFVTIVDIKKLKEYNISKLKKMDEEKFQKRYTKVYGVIKDLPLWLKVSYGIREDMNKERAIKNIESLDKKQMYEIIDNIPDAVIARVFKQYLIEKKQKIQKSNIAEQVKRTWSKIMEKTRIPTSSF